MRTLYSEVVGTDGSDVTTFVQIAGLSTDEKPTEGVSTGSAFYEVDTGLLAIYDESDNKWYGGTEQEGG